MGATASALKIATVRPFRRDPGTFRRKSLTSWYSFAASSTSSVNRPEMLISNIHGSQRSNCAEFCAAEASR